MDRKILAENVAKALLSIKAVFLRPSEPFTWASGIKSPVYCDNRLTLAYPEVRAVIENGIAEVIKAEYPEAEALMGTSTAGIPHAAIVSEKLNLPMGYVRSGNKEHGRGNRIKGSRGGRSHLDGRLGDRSNRSAPRSGRRSYRYRFDIHLRNEERLRASRRGGRKERIAQQFQRSEQGGSRRKIHYRKGIPYGDGVPRGSYGKRLARG